MASVSTMSQDAIYGEDLWQKNNCTSCHQLYGLGGYLGPDLTNLTSSPFKEKDYVFAILDGDVGAMPPFRFTVKEKEYLYEFLSHVDKTGFYPNKASFNAYGWGSLKYK